MTPQTRTYHVYRSDSGWIVQKVGKRGDAFRTQREAIAAARRKIHDAGMGQLVVYGKSDRMVDHRTYGLPRLLSHPKRSPLAPLIEQTITKMALERLRSDPRPPREHPPAK